MAKRTAAGRSDLALDSRVGRHAWASQLLRDLRQLSGSALTQAIELLEFITELLRRQQQQQLASARAAEHAADDIA